MMQEMGEGERCPWGLISGPSGAWSIERSSIVAGGQSVSVGGRGRRM